MCAMENELHACQMHRYNGDHAIVEGEDVRELRNEMFRYLDERQASVKVPTYFHYWEDENYRKNLWLLERDLIARDMLRKVSQAQRAAVDGGRKRLKCVGDGSHPPITNPREQEPV